jgi:hypothetical protein
MIYCCNCEKEVEAKKVLGKEIYPKREDLKTFVFWRCDTCKGYVGSHQGSRKKRPLGCIPSPEIKNARLHLHKLIDPVWQNNRMGRSKLYKLISNELGYTYHTANIKSIEEARTVYKIVLNIKKWLTKKNV